MIGRRWTLRLGLLGAGLAVGVSGGTTVAAWTAKVDTPAGTVQAIADWVAPAVSDVHVLKREGGTPGYLRPGGEFRVCATVGADSGNPASGLRDFATDLTSLATTLLAPLLTTPPAATCPASSNQDSGLKRLPTTATVGTKTITATSRDNAGNTQTESSSVVVDGVAPKQAASGFTTTNVAGGTAGRPETGDTITFSFDEPIDPHSVVPGWTGAAPATVYPYFIQSGNKDTLVVYRTDANGAAALTPLTTAAGVELNGNYVGATVYFNATMEVAGNGLRLTLGTVPANAAGTNLAANVGLTTGSTTATVWPAGTGMFDRAGNPLAAASQTEPLPLDREF
jgi:predicted ribosomally synthesized peptide with SipW-like signal peptide